MNMAFQGCHYYSFKTCIFYELNTLHLSLKHCWIRQLPCINTKPGRNPVSSLRKQVKADTEIREKKGLKHTYIGWHGKNNESTVCSLFLNVKRDWRKGKKKKEPKSTFVIWFTELNFPSENTELICFTRRKKKQKSFNLVSCVRSTSFHKHCGL